MESKGRDRPLLIAHPAGVFFALAAVMAVALPWLWLLGLEEPRLAHARLGLLGFGGLAVCGYVITAQKAWTGHCLPAPAVLCAAALALGGRLASLGFPGDLWPVLLLPLPVAAMILRPVLQVGRWDKAPLAVTPLLLVAAEALVVVRPELAGRVPMALAALVFLVGGRLVAAFCAESRRRRGLGAPRRLPSRPGAALLAMGLLHEGSIGTLALLATLPWVVVAGLGGLRLGPANRMLCLAYAGLVPGILAVVVTRCGLMPEVAQVHVLTMAVMGPMILAVAARVTMRRPAGAELAPRRRHWIALALIFAAALARGLAELPGQGPFWLPAAGLGWSAAWMTFLSVHVGALAKPAPFPLLSAERAARRAAARV